MKKLVLNIGLSLLALMGAVSCNIKEDMSNCPGSMILDYSAYSDVILDDIAQSDQEFLDLNKIWNISLIVKEQTSGNGYLALGINVNGWVVWFSSSELS